MMELDNGDVLEPVLFSPSSKSHIKYNSIIIMLLDQNNNTSHLCLILLLSILLLVLFYITLFMKTYQAARLKMMSKSAKKVHHHIHHKQPPTANVYKATGSGSNFHKLNSNGVSTNTTSGTSVVYQRSLNGSTSTSNSGQTNYHKLNSNAPMTNVSNSTGLYQRPPNSVSATNYQNQKFSSNCGSSNTTNGTSGVYQRSSNGASAPTTSGGNFQKVNLNSASTHATSSSSVYQRPTNSATSATNDGSNYHKLNTNGGSVNITNAASTFQKVIPSSASTGVTNGGSNYHKLNTNGGSPNTTNGENTYQKLNPNSAPTSANHAKSSWDGADGGSKSVSTVSRSTTVAHQKASCSLPPKTNPVEEDREEVEEKGKMGKKPVTSVGAAGSRKGTKEKNPSDSLYHRKSSHPRDSTPSPPSSDSLSPSKPNRKRNSRISEPPPWSGDPPAWLRPAAQLPSNLTDGVNNASRSSDGNVSLPDEGEELQAKLHQSEDEEDDDEACTTQSTASSVSNGSTESEVFTTSSGVSTGGSTRSSNVSCSSNSSDDGTSDPSNRSSDPDDFNKENRPDLTNLPGAPSSRETLHEIPVKVNAPPVYENSTVISGNSTLTRRQKKNRVRRNLELNARIPINKLSRFYQRLGMKDADLHKYLSAYAMTQQQLINFSFPFESKFYANKAVIYSPGRYNPKTLDPKAREFVPSPGFNISVNKKLLKNQDIMWRPDVVLDDKEADAQEEKICARCNKSFYLSASNRTSGHEGNYEYLTQENCHYHWGKVTKSWNNGIQNCIYSCCNEEQYKTLGCVYAKLHVWSGLKSGINGPLEGYVRTKPRKTPPPNGWGVYALDTEMVYTVHGLEVARVTVVNVDGRLIYNTLVKPDCEIIDYNTKYSGISARDYIKNPYKSLRDVQNDLMGFISRDSLIVGHGLENDMRALKIIHSNIIDTSILFPHVFGLPYRRSLKSIVSQLLHLSIQSGTHDSFEDARACVDLVLWKLINQLRFAQ